MYPSDSIQDAIDGVGEEDTIYVHTGTYVENMDMRNRLTLIGDGVGTAATNVYMDLEKY